MIKIIETEKNKPLIIYSDFMFRIAKTTQTKIIWRCLVKTCSSAAHSPLDFKNNTHLFRLITSHNHNSDLSKTNSKIKLFEMKRLILKTHCSVRFAIHTILRGCNIDIIEAVGPIDNLGKMLRRLRKNSINPKPYAYPTIKLSTDITTTHTKNLFYQYGPDQYRNLEHFDDFLIFSTDFQLQNLVENNIWSIDGTFQVVPSPWYQLYTISYVFNNRVFPAIFCILKNKRKETYDNLLNIIVQLKPDLNPRLIKTDFEISAINAFQNKFKNSIISGCQFHLGQCFIRKLKDINLFYEYKSNNNLKKFVKALQTLSFVKSNHIIETYNELKNDDMFPSQLNELYEYFFSNFICSTSARFKVETWNFMEYYSLEIPKTNNAIEGWHNTFKNTFGTSRFSFELLIYKLKEEEEVIRQKKIRIDIGERFRRKRKYVRIENNINNYIINVERKWGKVYCFGLVDLLFY